MLEVMLEGWLFVLCEAVVSVTAGAVGIPLALALPDDLRRARPAPDFFWTAANVVGLCIINLARVAQGSAVGTWNSSFSFNQHPQTSDEQTHMYIYVSLHGGSKN